jgi:hypothetical protein
VRAATVRRATARDYRGRPRSKIGQGAKVFEVGNGPFLGSPVALPERGLLPVTLASCRSTESTARRSRQTNPCTSPRRCSSTAWTRPTRPASSSAAPPRTAVSSRSSSRPTNRRPTCPRPRRPKQRQPRDLRTGGSDASPRTKKPFWQLERSQSSKRPVCSPLYRLHGATRRCFTGVHSARQ